MKKISPRKQFKSRSKPTGWKIVAFQHSPRTLGPKLVLNKVFTNEKDAFNEKVRLDRAGMDVFVWKLHENAGEFAIHAGRKTTKIKREVNINHDITVTSVDIESGREKRVRFQAKYPNNRSMWCPLAMAIRRDMDTRHTKAGVRVSLNSVSVGKAVYTMNRIANNFITAFDTADNRLLIPFTFKITRKS